MLSDKCNAHTYYNDRKISYDSRMQGHFELKQQEEGRR